MNNLNSIKRFDLFRYGSLALPLAFSGMPLYIHAPDYYATQYGISLGTLGAILLFVRLIDAIQDPLLGILSDSYPSSRKLFFIFGLILLGASFYSLFHPDPQFVLWWFILSIISATSAYSILTINLNALGSNWSKDIYQKTRITSFREAFALIGLLIVIITPSILDKFINKIDSFHYLSFLLIGLIILSSLFFFSWVNKHHELEIPKNKGLIKSISKSHKSFYSIYGISMMASAIPAVLVLFYIRDYLKLEENTGVFLLLYFLSGVIAMPFWQYLSLKKGKIPAWLLSMILAILAFIWTYFLKEGQIWQYSLICMGSGIALGAELSLPPSILSDLLDENKSQGNSSGHFAILTFLGKIVLALASGVTFFILSKGGYQPGEINSINSLKILNISYSLIPCFIKIFAIILLWQWQSNKGEKNVSNNNSNCGSKSYVR